MTSHPIEVRGLVKNFGRVRALDGLDLTVEAGQVHGFLGPNGAGKSTTIRTLLGLYRPDGGQARVFGMDPIVDSATINVSLSYVAGDVALWPNLTGGQVLDVLAGLRGRRNRAREDELTQRFELDLGKRVRTYSKGNRQKVALVAALAAPVDLMIFDEPTAGLDPLMERVFQAVIAERVADGCTILLSSHILAEVQQVCSSVTIIREGRTVESGDLDHLRSLSLTRVSLGVPKERYRDVGAALEGLRLSIDEAERRLVVAVPPAVLPSVMAIAAEAGLTDVLVEPASLEDLFLRHYTGHRNAEPTGGGGRNPRNADETAGQRPTSGLGEPM